MDPVARVDASLAAIGRDPFNAFISFDATEAHAAAQAEAQRGPAGRALHGFTLSVKDNLAVAGMRMTCGSRHLAEYVAPYTATVVARLERAGAVVVGKTNMDEFAAGSSGENSAFGRTLNPREPSRVPGGSSSGAGASVAAGYADLALGSDTGGSVRCPAAFCGVAALKPSYGLVSRYGLADLAMSLEGPAPMARTVTDVARGLTAIAGPDPHDATTAHAPRGTDYAAGLAEADARGLRVGVLAEFFGGVAPDVECPVRDAIGALERAGARVTSVSVPALKRALSIYYVLNYGEFASAMQRLDGLRYGAPGSGADYNDTAADARASFGPEVKRRILLGTFVTSRGESARWTDRAQAAKATLAADVDRAFGEVDVLVGPTMPMRAFPLGARVADPLALYAADVLTVGANLAGIPAGSVPLKVEGLPVGFQVMGARGADATVLRAMRAVERVAGVEV
ncbi:MAG: amidase family protein [Thermoplasmatota archaeon]